MSDDVGRTDSPNPRTVLLDKIVAHVARHGLSDLSLRQIATAVGTSHRMIVYHFGNREGLVAAIVQQMEAQQRDVLEHLGAAATSHRDLVLAQWEQLCDPGLRPFVILFFEVLALALQQRPGTDRFLDHLTSPWLELGGALSGQLGHPTDRTEILLGIAVVRGLLLEAVASGDHVAPTAALHRFLELWDNGRSS